MQTNMPEFFIPKRSGVRSAWGDACLAVKRITFTGFGLSRSGQVMDAASGRVSLLEQYLFWAVSKGDEVIQW
jgi:hypothetical protein